MVSEKLDFSHGTIKWEGDAAAQLAKELQGVFKAHPILQGVEIRNIDFEKIPAQIRQLIKELLNQTITDFTAVRAAEVGMHKHTDNGEIYFGGSGIVTVQNEQGKVIETIQMDLDTFSIVHKGQSHGVSSNTVPFFAIKFVQQDQNKNT